MSSLYIYKNRLVDMRIHTDPTEAESRIFGAHFNYLKDLTARGQVLLAGPCTDAAFGIVIFRAESDKAAQALMDNDPAIREGIMTADLHPFVASLFAPEGWTNETL